MNVKASPFLPFVDFVDFVVFVAFVVFAAFVTFLTGLDAIDELLLIPNGLAYSETPLGHTISTLFRLTSYRS